MAELHILTLKCVKKHDPAGKDEAVLKIGSRVIAGPPSLGKGDSTTAAPASRSPARSR